MFETMEGSRAASLWSRLVSRLLGVKDLAQKRRGRSNRLDVEEMPESQKRDLGLEDRGINVGRQRLPTAFDAARDSFLRRPL
ncbi:hypothetical protein [Rhizobium oryzicola]|uniref:DUF1127 domain-containing protein n=1 Tax=Rhizobium oryzicola TaxID=1232668 RepID=A0ABT8SW16_9HYPH|nr:hypothetical protein [Rhizobium oryzicola]MDO1582243.1 hypothetical protein [Rhizobium oryzicola]